MAALGLAQETALLLNKSSDADGRHFTYYRAFSPQALRHYLSQSVWKIMCKIIVKN